MATALPRVALLLCAFALLPRLALAGAGDLDASFGDRGFKRFGFGHGQDSGNGVAVQPDGKIVLAGYCQSGDHDEVGVARYNADGSSDLDFGGGDGKLNAWVTPAGDPAFPASDYGVAVALQTDGKILVAGFGDAIAGRTPFVLRFKGDGTPDSSFAGDGSAAVPLGGSFPCVTSLAVQADGKILVAGSNGTHTAVARLTTAGALDGGFGAGGVATFNLDPNGDVANAMVVQPDGLILLAGGGTPPSNVREGLLVRLATSGTLDGAFGAAGVQRYSLAGGPDELNALALQTSPSAPTLIVAGATYNGLPGAQMAVARFKLNGTPDSTFNLLGTAPVPGKSGAGARGVFVRYAGATPDRIYVMGTQTIAGQDYYVAARYLLTGALDPAFDGDGIAMQPTTGTLLDCMASSGGLPVLGGAGTGAGADLDFVLVRFNASGGLDAAFDGDGRRTQDIGDAPAWASRMIRDSNGRYVIVGRVQTGLGIHAAIARLNSSGQPDLSFGSGGGVATFLSSDVDSFTAVAEDPQGRYVAVGSSGPANGTEQVLLARFLANGQLDPGINGTGSWKISVNTRSRARAVLIQTDQRILIGGTTYGPFFPSRTLVIRAFNDASLDGSFAGGTGIAQPSMMSCNVQAMALQPDGKIVVGGDDTSLGGYVDVARLDASGNADLAFGPFGLGGNLVNIASTNAVGRDLALLPDGRIVEAASALNGQDFGVVRFKANGIADSTFDGDGGALPGLDFDVEDQAYAVAVQPDGRYVLAGEITFDGQAPDFALLRTSSAGVKDATFASGAGSAVLDLRGGSRDVARSAVLDNVGRIVVAGESGGLFAAARYVGDGSLVDVPALPGRAPQAGLALASVGGNPFRGGAAFAFSLPRAGAIALDVFDVTGAHVRSLARGDAVGGAHRVAWDGTDDAGRRAPRGLYFVRLWAAGSEATIKVTRLD